CIAYLLDGLSLRRIGVDGVGNRPQTEAADRRHRQLRDHVPRVGGNGRGPENLVTTRTNNYLDKPFVLAVQGGPVQLVQLLRKGAERDALLFGLVFVQADVGDLRVRVSTPWDGQRAGAGATFEQGVLDDDARHGVGGVRELEARADVAGGVNVP